MKALAVARAFCILHSREVVPDYELILETIYYRFLTAGDTVVDIGAHVGRHSCAFSGIVGQAGRVIAFEPIPEFVQRLRDALPAYPGREVRQVALSNKTGQALFHFAPAEAGKSGLQYRTDIVDRRFQSTFDVEVDTLDRQLGDEPNIAFIKLDVEGGEIDVLLGGETTIKRTRPFIAIEYGAPTYTLYGHTKLSLWHWCERNGYSISDLFGNLMEGPDEWSQVCDSCYWDWFLVPNARREEWAAIFA